MTEVVSGFGQLGVPAEKLAKRAVGRMTGYLESSAFAGPHLADQLLLPFALAGSGAFTTVKPSRHSLSATAASSASSTGAASSRSCLADRTGWRLDRPGLRSAHESANGRFAGQTIPCNGVDALLDLMAIDGVVFGGNSQP